MAKQLSLASWVSKRKKRRVGDPEESLAVRYSNIVLSCTMIE